MKPTDAPAPAKPIQVVVVDDHPVLVTYLTQLLERHGRYQIVGRAETATAALEVCRKLKPALIVLDICLLDSDDLACLHALRAELPRSRVLVFTGRLDRARVVEMLEAGASGIIGKTAPALELTDAVDRVAQGGIYLCPTASDAIRRQVVAGPGPVARNPGPELSRRELTVLQHIASGLSSRQIAAKMGLSQNTITAFRSRLMKKTGEHSAARLVLYAARLGLVRVPGLRKATTTPTD